MAHAVIAEVELFEVELVLVEVECMLHCWHCCQCCHCWQCCNCNYRQ